MANFGTWVSWLFITFVFSMQVYSFLLLSCALFRNLEYDWDLAISFIVCSLHHKFLVESHGCEYWSKQTLPSYHKWKFGMIMVILPGSLCSKFSFVATNFSSVAHTVQDMRCEIVVKSFLIFVVCSFQCEDFTHIWCGGKSFFFVLRLWNSDVQLC